jgi:hypothetical protein
MKKGNMDGNQAKNLGGRYGSTPPLSYAAIKAIVSSNNRSIAFSDEAVISICWKESSFIQDAHYNDPGKTAKGLMGMTDGAVDTVNNITPPGTHYEYQDMLDGAKAIQCGSIYLQYCFNQIGGNDEVAALNRYGGTSNYAQNVVQAEQCLRNIGLADPMNCLNAIHPIDMETVPVGDD